MPEKTSSPSTSDTDLEEAESVAVEVTQPMLECDPKSITAASPKRYIVAALSVDFAVKAGTTETLEKGKPFKSGNRAGDSRPDIVKKHLWVEGRHPAAMFSLHFVDNRFVEATVCDVAGWPTELWSKYEPSALALKQQKDEPERAFRQRVDEIMREAKRRDWEYNDGEFWVNPAPRRVSTGMALDEWFADMVPGFEPRKPPVRKQKQQETATAVELIEAGEWIG